MNEQLTWQLKRWLRPTELMASEIMDILILPSKGELNYLLPISIGTEEDVLQQHLGDYILREHTTPLKGIDKVVSANAYPVIYRYALIDGKVAAAIVEIGLHCGEPKKVFQLLEDKLRRMFTQSLEGHADEGCPHTIYTWEFAKHHCYLQVVSDRLFKINILQMDSRYFGRNVEGTFVRMPNERNIVMPTIAVVFGREQVPWALAVTYLQMDIGKRQEAVAWLQI